MSYLKCKSKFAIFLATMDRLEKNSIKLRVQLKFSNNNYFFKKPLLSLWKKSDIANAVTALFICTADLTNWQYPVNI